LRLIRAHIAVNHRTLHRIVTGAPFRGAVGALGGAQLAGMPRGYVARHPAAEYLRHKQFLAGRQFEAKLATTDRFYPELLRVFRAVAPLVRFLNAPLLAGRRAGLPASALRASAARRSPGEGGKAVPYTRGR